MRWLDAVAKLLPFVALGLYALAVWLARGRRREALRNTGIGLAVGAGLLLLAVGALRDSVLDRVVSEPEARDAAGALWRIVESPLNAALWAVIALGAVLTLGAALAGPGRHATALRRSLAPYLEWRGFAIGIGTTVAVVLLLTGAIDSFVRLAWLVIFTAIAGFGIEALRRQALREFPDAAQPPLADWLLARWDGLKDRGRSATAAASSARSERIARSQAAGAAQDGMASESPAPAPAAPRPSAPSLEDLERLERLAGLHQSGALTDEEFATMKSRVVERVSRPRAPERAVRRARVPESLGVRDSARRRWSAGG